MNEDFFQYIWKMRLFDTSTLSTTDGEPVAILHSGLHNTDSGPDFLHAKIRIGETVWAGNVELHIRSSEWMKHRHHEDRAYDNVILHVVYEHDDRALLLPTVELKARINTDLLHTYARMMQSSAWIACEKSIAQVPKIIQQQQLNRLLTERLEHKALQMEQRLAANTFDWEETTYQLIARNFGTNVNAEPFERTARSISYKTIMKHLNDPYQVEALLFGQAGLLEATFKELYPNKLQAEYRFLKKKYQLEGIRPLEWKFLRLRPANFPTVRMSQFANLIARQHKLFSVIINTIDVQQLRKIFEVDATGYWREHYHFKKSVPVKSVAVGRDMIELILINTIAPLLFLYGRKTGMDSYIQRSTELLESLPPETNSIVRQWHKLGVASPHAGTSQALLELKSQHCDRRRCLECAIGHSIIGPGTLVRTPADKECEQGGQQEC